MSDNFFNRKKEEILPTISSSLPKISKSMPRFKLDTSGGPLFEDDGKEVDLGESITNYLS